MQKTKKIISAIVAMFMLLGIMVPMASAVEFSDVATTHKYYTAISNLSAYGILDGFEDGTFHPDDNVTRAQFAKIICYALDGGSSITGPVETGFTDVASGHWAAGNIKMAASRGIINGMGDGTFAPEANIKFEQAVKMIVCALGYGNHALQSGGYPQGYINVAVDLKLLKGLATEDNKQGTDASRGTIAKLVDTMLETEQLTITGEQGSSIKEQNVKTSSKSGQVVSVYGSTIFEGETSDCSKNQIELLIGSKRYKYSVEELGSIKNNIGGYLGKRVTVYYDTDDELSVPTLTNLTLQAKKNIVTDVDISDIEDFSDSAVEYITDADSGDTEKITINSDVNILENGVATSEGLSDIIDLSAPGQITFIDSDADGSADVIFIKSYTTLVVKSKTNSAFKIYGENSENLILDEELSSITIKRNGKSAEFKDINVGDIVSYAKSADDKVIDVLVSSTAVSGSISQIRTNGQIKIKTSSGENTYTTSSYFDSNPTVALEVGLSGKFHIDAFGKIAKVDVSSAASYTYAYLCDLKNMSASMDSEYAVRVIKINGASNPSKITYSLANKFKIDGESFSDSDDLEDIKEVFKTSAANYDPGFDTFEPDSQIGQVIKFTTNSSGEIDRIFTVDYEADDANKLSITEKTDIKCTTTGQRLAGIYNISGAKVLLLSEETDGTDKIKGSSASYFKASSSTKYDLLIVDLDDNYKTPVVIVYGASATATVQWEDYAPMVVTEKGQEIVDGREDPVTYVSVIKHSGDTAKYYAGEDAAEIFDSVEKGDIIRVSADSKGNVDAKKVTTTLAKMLAAGGDGGQTAGAKGEGTNPDTERAEYRQIFGTAMQLGSETLRVAMEFGTISSSADQELITVNNSTKVILIDTANIERANAISEVALEEIIGYEDKPDEASKILIYTSNSQTAKTIFIFR
ncbi:MAG: S-layer homology domain-containing protein [Ruminococcaceae bacterium]|nr:S-layer homology domain-containing protein [Oscillospiraceae bacterium]